MMGQKGVITVYLSLVFLIVLSLIFTVIDSARIQPARMLLETALDSGLESMVAGYHKELYEEYHIFFFDGAFGSEHVSETGLSNALEQHMNYTLYPHRGTVLSNTDFYKTTTNTITIDKVALATDDNGKVFRNQVVDYMKSSMGITMIEQLTDKYNWAMNNISESSAYTEMEEENGKVLTELEDDKSAIDQEKWEDSKTAESQKNPSKEMEAIRSTGILELVCEEPSNLSQRSIDLDSLPSHRQLTKGTGLESYDESITSNLMFQAYLMKQFRHGASKEQPEDDNLKYQIEYLLVGEGHDIDNLKGIINRILLIREGANFAYLLTDAQKVAEAYSAAALLVGYTGIAPLIEATKYAILLAWAYAESVLDARVLLAGEKVALTKNAANWKTSLANIAEVAGMNPKEMADSNGVTYEEYLQMMLMTGNQEQITMRALDLIELEIQQVTQNSGFKVDNCIAIMEATVNAQSESVFLSLPFMKSFSYKGVSIKASGRCSYEE